MNKYIIKNKFRFMVSVSLIMIIAVTSVFTLAVSARGNSEVSMIPEYVEEGDTLWSLSSDYSGEMDIRDYIDRVIDINGLQSATIRPGELLYFTKYN
jgi:hypothetical protein